MLTFVSQTVAFRYLALKYFKGIVLCLKLKLFLITFTTVSIINNGAVMIRDAPDTVLIWPDIRLFKYRIPGIRRGRIMDIRPEFLLHINVF
jgi:hypothetical protein